MHLRNYFDRERRNERLIRALHIESPWWVRRCRWVLLAIWLLVLATHLVLVTTLNDRRWWWITSVAAVILVFFGTHWRQRAIQTARQRKPCLNCGQSLLNLPIQDGATRCPECGEIADMVVYELPVN